MKHIATILLPMLMICCSPETDTQDKHHQETYDPDPVHLSVRQDAKPVDDWIFGYNTQSIKGPGWEREDFIGRITELNPGNFRYPGGTVGNFWDWKTDGRLNRHNFVRGKILRGILKSRSSG